MFNARMVNTEILNEYIIILDNTLNNNEEPNEHDNNEEPIEIDIGLKSIEEELLDNIKNGDTDTAIYLISKGVVLPISEQNINSALHWAAIYDNVEIIKVLLDMGMDVNIKNYYEHTPLHLSILSYNVDVFLYLIDRGADVNAYTQSRTTPLRYAAQINDIGMVRYLIQKGANIFTCDIDNNRFIHCAIEGIDKIKEIFGIIERKGINEIKEMNIESNINIESNNNTDSNNNIESNNNNIKDNEDIIILIIDEYLKRGGDVNIRNAAGNTSLHIAAAKGYMKVIDFLIKKGANLFSTTGNCLHTPIKTAIKYHKLDAVKYFIKLYNENYMDNFNKYKEFIIEYVKKNKNFIYGSRTITSKNIDDIDNNNNDIDYNNNIDDIDNNNIDHDINDVNDIKKINDNKRIKNIKKINALVDKECDIHEMNLISCAIISDDLDIAKYLISIGLDVDYNDGVYGTALHYAKNLESAKLLLYNGADINSVFNKHRTPFINAVTHDRHDVMLYLIERGVNVNEEISGYTPLYYSFSHRDNTDTLKLLIDNGADINNCGYKTGGSVLYAIRNYYYEHVKLLLKYGANLYETTKQKGDNVLHITVYDGRRIHDVDDISIHNRSSMFTLLVRKGADVWQENNDGETPYDVAIRRNVTWVIDILKNYPRVIPLVGMCIRVVRKNKMDTLWLPPIIFKFPNLLL